MNALESSSSPLRPEGYVPRIVDARVERYLSIFGAIEIAGTKWCGKTWTACAHGASITYIDRDNNLQLAQADPHIVLEGARPHIVDEWQKAPGIWNAVRHEIDLVRGLRGGWILTGSSTPPKDSSRHSGAGRIGRIRMLPMSLSESFDSTQSVSLAGLFRGEFTVATVPHDTRALVELCCRGGWPETFDDDYTIAQHVAREYLQSIYEQSAPTHGKNPQVTERLVQSIARNLGQTPTLSTTLQDMNGFAVEVKSEKTLSEYLDFLKGIFLIQEIPGWVPASRSPKRLRTKPKRYFADPSLPIAALGLSPEGLFDDWQTFGLVFENLCIRDLLVYASALELSPTHPVKYYRDDSGLEVDAIIELTDGSWAAFEFKVSEDKVDEGIASLKRLRKKLGADKNARNKPPSFMAVITGNGEFARQAEEGIYVIPIRALTA